MRFTANGPSLPNDLLVARDEGQVIFFCGAGVSRARVGLADFYGLANAVADELGASKDSPARKLLTLAASQEKIAGVGGLMAADRVFGLLEREFETVDVRRAVAKALKPKPDPDLSAHQILLDLATGPDGQVRLVTTNFDLLFQDCAPALKVCTPPALPDPRRDKDFRGIVHLHGRVNDDYSAAHDDEFVLSSADFGRAYLAEGWATRFIRDLLSQYQLVFVGYTADDPPVQYLLEALNDRSLPARGLYAFQAGDADEAKALWGAKGVEAIAFDPADGYHALWSTLEAWAERARDPAAWREKVLSRAADGPRDLAPHERGQLAHIVSTASGARHFASASPPPPAEWLAVLDPAVRFGNPDRGRSEEGVDPFTLYGLDDDLAPPPRDPEDFYVRRDIPSSAWDGFALSRHDRAELGDQEAGALRGSWAHGSPRLVRRLRFIGDWIAKVATQPAAVWWAAGQGGLHPELVSLILADLDRRKDPPSLTEAAWRLLGRAWAGRSRSRRGDLFALAQEAKRGGWTPAMARDYADALRPRLQVQRSGGAAPPIDEEGLAARDLLSVDVLYPARRSGIAPGDAVLSVTLAELRKALELGLALRQEVGRTYGLNIPPIHRDPQLSGDAYQRSQKLAGLFFHYLDLFERLRLLDLQAAIEELAAWRSEDEVAARLRIWAAGEADLRSPDQAAAVLLAISEDDFWASHHQRDLMLALKARWAQFSQDGRQALEQRLLAGRPAWPGEAPHKAEQARAWGTIQRLQWLVDNGCPLSMHWPSQKARLIVLAPEWQDESTQHAAASMEGRSGWVQTDPDPAVLLEVPVGQLLDVAETRADQRDLMSLVEHRPLEGLAKSKPTRLLKALVLAGKHGEVRQAAWETFLDRTARESDGPRLRAQIAERLSRLPAEDLAPLLLTATRWFQGASANDQTPAATRLWTAMIATIQIQPDAARSAILGNHQDWTSLAINSPTGALAQALMQRPDRESEPGPGFDPTWRAQVEQLLSLPEDARRYAAVTLLMHNLGWFYFHDRPWTEERLLSLLDGDEDDRAAFWAGFLSGGRVPNADLFDRLKPAMLALVGQTKLDHDYTSNLATLLLAGWGTRVQGTGPRYVADEAFRNALMVGGDQFRAQVLWQLERWRSDPTSGWRNEAAVLFETTWPRQRNARTPATTGDLVELVMAASDDFPRMVAAVTPLLGKLATDPMIFAELLHSEADLVGQHPLDLLSLLYVVLPEAAQEWPYGADTAVTRLAENGVTALDPRMIDLRRRLSAR